MTGKPKRTNRRQTMEINGDRGITVALTSIHSAKET
jgi:hypothetical protein